SVRNGTTDVQIVSAVLVDAGGNQVFWDQEVVRGAATQAAHSTVTGRFSLGRDDIGPQGLAFLVSGYKIQSRLGRAVLAPAPRRRARCALAVYTLPQVPRTPLSMLGDDAGQPVGRVVPVGLHGVLRGTRIALGDRPGDRFVFLHRRRELVEE